MIRRPIVWLVLFCAGWMVNAAEPNPSPLVVLAQQAPNASAWVLAPLDRTVPGDIRQNLTFLREQLLDEWKTQPKTGLDAYKSGFLLCNGLIAALDEREQTLVRAGVITAEANARTGSTSQSLDARRNYQMSWPQYARERDERDELTNQAANKAALLKERPKVEWAARVTQLRSGWDGVYAKFRDSLRQSPALVAMIAGATPKEAPAAPTGAASVAGVALPKRTEEERPASGGTMQILAEGKPVDGATVIVAEVRPEDEEVLVAEEKSEAGKVAFAFNPAIKYNVYVIMDGYEVFLKKRCSAASLPQVNLKSLPAGSKVVLGQKGTGASLAGDDLAEILPVRANQGSPPFQWILKISGLDVLVDNGTKMTSGEFWAKHGESFRLTSGDQKVTCQFVGSIGRKYVIFQCKNL